MRNLLVYLAALAAFFTPGQLQPEQISSKCLGCICEAASSCSRAQSCRGDVCGLFAISRPYWVDAGQPTVANDNPSNPGAFERCVKDITCAAETVKKYLYIYVQDCNRDGEINCIDYVKLHMQGGYGCNSPAEPGSWNRFTTCMQIEASND